MNFANYVRINAYKYRSKICLIERSPITGQRRVLTWGEIEKETNKIANYLSKSLGVKRGDRVLHLLNNSLEWITTYLAIIKLGAVVVPLNFRFIGKDILYAFKMADPKVFILGEEFLERVKEIRNGISDLRHYIVVGDSCPCDMISFAEIETSNDTEEATIEVQDDADLALMFTSGTTGKAKPVVHTHGSLNATAIGNGMSVPLDIDDNYLIILPLYHSGSLFLWFPYYALGASGTIIRGYKDPICIFETIHEERGSGLLLVVPICVDIINRIKSGEISPANYNLSCWKYIMTGAQPVPHKIFESLMKLLPVKLIHTYGITEGGGGITWSIWHDEILRRPGSIGKPNFGVEAHLLDEEENLVALGEIGEIVFKTPRLMKGYYNNDEMTFNSVREGYLHTGDLARVDKDGFYYIVDRKKDMISSGGENIYPVEIEEVLHQHPDIEYAAIIGYPDERLVEIVMAVVQMRHGASVREEEIISFCKSRLALYKVPRKVVFDLIPRNATGKVLKMELRERYFKEKENV